MEKIKYYVTLSFSLCLLCLCISLQGLVKEISLKKIYFKVFQDLFQAIRNRLKRLVRLHILADLWFGFILLSSVSVEWGVNLPTHAYFFQAKGSKILKRWDLRSQPSGREVWCLSRIHCARHFCKPCRKQFDFDSMHVSVCTLRFSSCCWQLCHICWKMMLAKWSIWSYEILLPLLID